MKIVIDTNIIFSFVLNVNNSLGSILFNSDDLFKFYSCHFMRAEIQKHKSKLMRISKLSELQLEESLFALYNKITFINESLIPKKIWEEAEQLVKDIDIDDIDFIALTKHLKAMLWTGDKALYLKLQKKGFNNILVTSRLLEIRKKLIT